jgi:hypothetical protein
VGKSYEKKAFYFSIYFLIAILVIGYSYSNSQVMNSNFEIKKLYLEDAILIFILNSVQIIFWFLLSPFGLSLPFILKFLYSMGQGPNSTDINPFLYYSSSVTHGFGEILVSYIVIVFTIKQFYCFYKVIKTKETEILKKLYIKLMKKYIPISLIILLISSLMEVYVSNRIILHFVG